MTKLVIEMEELPTLRNAGDFFKLMAVAYQSDCMSGSFEYGFQQVEWEIQE